MSPNLDELVVRLTTEEDWKILKTVRLESLLIMLLQRNIVNHNGVAVPQKRLNFNIF
ncbi:hypothetical protein F901_02402 [Acinetobacter dispersus]|nr:hypothetical protein F901_02402 [Acinetobacter dispersus]